MQKQFVPQILVDLTPASDRYSRLNFVDYNPPTARLNISQVNSTDTLRHSLLQGDPMSTMPRWDSTRMTDISSSIVLSSPDNLQRMLGVIYAVAFSALLIAEPLILAHESQKSNHSFWMFLTILCSIELICAVVRLMTNRQNAQQLVFSSQAGNKFDIILSNLALIALLIITAELLASLRGLFPVLPILKLWLFGPLVLSQITNVQQPRLQKLRKALLILCLINIPPDWNQTVVFTAFGVVKFAVAWLQVFVLRTHHLAICGTMFIISVFNLLNEPGTLTVSIAWPVVSICCCRMIGEIYLAPRLKACFYTSLELLFPTGLLSILTVAVWPPGPEQKVVAMVVGLVLLAQLYLLVMFKRADVIIIDPQMDPCLMRLSTA